MVAHSFGYGNLGSGRQTEGWDLREEGVLSLYQICNLLGKGYFPTVPTPRHFLFPNLNVCSFMSIPFSLATHSGGRSETRSFRDGQRTLFWVAVLCFVFFFFLYINKKTPNYPKMTPLPLTSQCDLRRKQGLSCDSQGLGSRPRPSTAWVSLFMYLSFHNVLMLTSQGLSFSRAAFRPGSLCTFCGTGGLRVLLPNTQAPSGPRPCDVTLLFIPRVVAEFSPTIKVVNVL